MENPYQSPTEVAEAVQPAPRQRLGIVRLYRVIALAIFIVTMALSFTFWTLSVIFTDEQIRSFLIYLIPVYHLYVWMIIATMLWMLALPLRVVYLLIWRRFHDSAIDAVLTVAAFGVVSIALRLAPVSA
jgi:hypothetical protein